MITEPISITGKLTLDETLDLNRYCLRCVMRPSIQFLLGVVSILIATAIVLKGVATHFTHAPIFILLLCAYYPWGWLMLRHHRIVRHYRRHPEKIIEHTATLTNDSVSISCVHMDMRLNWDQIGSVVSAPRGLLFLLPPHAPLFWLPQRLLVGNNYREAILELAAEHSILIRQMA